MNPIDCKVITDPLTESNCYILLEQQHCVVIDPNVEAEILALFQQRLLTPELILLTHEHADHISALTVLRERYPEAILCVSDACNDGIADRRINMSQRMEVYLSFRGKAGVTYAPFTCAPADCTFSGSIDLPWRGHRFHLFPLPGHSPGGTGILLDDVLFFSGDYLLPDDEVILRFPGGDEKAYLEITKPTLECLPDGLRVYPGHGKQYILNRA